MIPLIPTLALAFLSFISSSFVILRILIPILPPSPLSRRVAPSEFGLPNFRSLSPADKSHIWLASLDLLALAVFVWQAVMESTGSPQAFAAATDPASSVRLWFAMTVRQTCLLVVASITLLHVRLGRSVSFGKKHWMLWTPTALLVVTSTALAGVLSGAGLPSLFVGLVAYTSTVAAVTSVAFACLIGTLLIIKRNLSALNEVSDPWPPVREMEDKPRPSFATEEIDAIRDGASWITSNASSRHDSISQWSFTTHNTTINGSSHHASSSGRPHPATGSHPSIPPKSTFWFNPSTTHLDVNIPPVPPLPSPYGPLSPTAQILSDPDPFRRDCPTPLPDHPRQRLGSQTSWLTSTNGSHVTLSAWSYPTSHHSEGTIRNGSSPDLRTDLLPSVTRPATPAMANAQVLGGYGFAPGSLEAEKGLAALAAPPGTEINISVYRAVGWMITVWVPLGLSFPYLFSVLPNSNSTSQIASILLILSITLSSPLLALNILFRSPIPIPSGLFDVHGEVPSNVIRGPSPAGSLPYKWSHEYKRSMSTSVTVVEGRRSGDVWITNGDAIDGKTKVSRAMGMLAPKPKLSVLPPEEEVEKGEVTPPLPMQMDDSSLPITVHNTPHSETSAEMGRIRKESKASSYYSGADESLAYASRIMVAQRHYSTLAQTVLVGPSTSPQKRSSEASNLALATASGAQAISKRPTSHLRSRSVSSISGPQTPTSGSFNISPPPSFPLPPTPPNVRAARLAQLKHKKSFSSGFSFGAVDDMNEIDALTAGVLPLLIPGLKVGEGMRITSDRMDGTFGKGRKRERMMREFGQDFSSPEVHSTPARRRPRELRTRKTSAHKKNHFSLPSLGLGKDGVHSLAAWSADVKGALETKVGQYMAPPNHVDVGRRNTVWGGEYVPNDLNAVIEEDELLRPKSPGVVSLGRALSTRSLGLRAEVPHNIDTARSSINSVNMLPPSAASTVTLFEFEAGLEGSGPQAESTPHNSISQKPKSILNRPPPLPLPDHITTRRASRRSSIVYIKSDDQPAVTSPGIEPESVTPPLTIKSSFAQWSSRVRPLIPKASKLQRKISDTSSSPPSATKGSPSGGLRPLSLLQERDSNTPVVPATRPLILGKKSNSGKSRMRMATVDENGNENVDPAGLVGSRKNNQNINLRPSQLTRSETSKMRGMLRKGEVLPDVVVRPPSQSEHVGFAYTFRD